MQNSDAKKTALPSYQEYTDAVASIKNEEGKHTPFTSFEQVAQCFKNLQIIKVCHRAEREKLKEENEKARIRIEAERQAEIEAAEQKKKLKAWAKSTKKLLKQMS